MATRRDRETEPSQSLNIRRQLRANTTTAEQLLWAMLRNRRLNGAKFRRQHSIANYVVDFACVEHKLVVELDGAYHDMVIEKDLRRQREIEAAGFQVLRFENSDVENDPETVAAAIKRAM